MKALVIGQDGQIGQALSDYLSTQGWTVIGTSRRTGSGGLLLDLANLPSCPVLPDVDVAFLCAAMTKQAACRENPDESYRVNVQAPTQLSRLFAAQGVQVVYLSTNAVFDGSLPCRLPNSPVSPLTAYGHHKAEAEKAVLAAGGTVLRLTKVLTPDMPLFVSWITALAEGRSVTAFNDLYMAPVALTDVVKILAVLAHSKAKGVFQFSATRDVSYFEACRHLADRMGVSGDLVCEASAADAGIPVAERPANTSLDCSALPVLAEALVRDPLRVIDRVFSDRLSCHQLKSPHKREG